MKKYSHRLKMNMWVFHLANKKQYYILMNNSNL